MARKNVDTKRALRNALVVMTTFTAFGGTTTLAWANSQPGVGHRGSWSPPVVKTRVWKTSAQPNIVVRRPKVRNKGIALDQVVQRSWSIREFRCLDNLWTKESNWNHHAYNSSSGAYGIPQALPGGKMRGAGSDWKSNPATQIRWGLGYIKGRYGKPCGAWGHWMSHNWY
jgi:hypothetical protein